MSSFLRQLLVNLGIIVGSFIIFGAGLSLLGRDIAAKSAQTVSDKALITKRTSSLSSLAALKATAPQADQYRQKINLLLPVQDQLLGFPQYARTIGIQHQLVVNAVFQGGPSAPMPTQAGSIGFLIDASGSQDNLKAFLSDMESRGTKYLVSLDTLDLTVSDHNHHAVIQGHVFFQATPSSQ